jgi:hypothetical protein
LRFAAAARLLEEGFGDEPPLAEALQHRVLVEGLADHAAENGGDAVRLAGDAGLGQVAGEQPVLRGRARVGVADAPAAERRRRAGGEAQAGRDLQRARRGFRVVPAQLGDRRRRAERAPGAVRMRGRAEPRRHADPRAGLVAGDHGVEQQRAVRVPRLGLGQGGGHGVDAGMAAGGVVALVEFQRRAGEAVEEGRHRRRRSGIGAGQAAVATGHRVAPHHRAHRRVALPRHDGAERVGQHQPGAVATAAGTVAAEMPARCAARVAVGDIGAAPACRRLHAARGAGRQARRVDAPARGVNPAAQAEEERACRRNGSGTAMSINGKAYIVGAFEHPTRKADDKSVAQLHAEVAYGALQDAGLSKDDIDGYFCTSAAPGLGPLNMADYLG